MERAITIMRNIFISEYRGIPRPDTAIISDAEAYTPALPHADNRRPEGTISAKDMTEILNALSDEYRVPYTLFVTGHRYGEIAQKMNIQQRIVKRRITIVHRQLKHTMADYC